MAATAAKQAGVVRSSEACSRYDDAEDHYLESRKADFSVEKALELERYRRKQAKEDREKAAEELCPAERSGIDWSKVPDDEKIRVGEPCRHCDEFDSGLRYCNHG